MPFYTRSRMDSVAQNPEEQAHADLDCPGKTSSGHGSFSRPMRGAEIVSPLVRQLPWTGHLIIMGQSKRRRTRVLHATDGPGAMEQAGSGASVPRCPHFGDEVMKVFRV